VREDSRPVLLVEDNPDDEELTVRSLRRAGVKNEIRVARDGVAALRDLLDESPERQPLSFVLLDLMLPKVNGFDVLARMRQIHRLKNLPVVVLTSSDAPDDIVRSYALGANSYVRKPMDYQEFSAAVQQLGLYWLALNLSASDDVR
jgi:two-component system response regulator